MRFLTTLRADPRSGWRFHWRLVPFLATLLLLGLGIGLAQWQMHRASQKQAIAVTLMQRHQAPILEATALSGQEAALEFRRVRLHGQFVSGWPLYLDNRPVQGRAGRYVMMPFQLADSGRVVMVARGWVARDGHDRTHVPPLVTPAGSTVIEGTVRSAPGRVMALGQAPVLVPGAIVQNLDLPEFARASGMPVAPYMVEQGSDSGDGLLRDWPAPSAGIERHLGYAFQWYALAMMAGVFFVATGLKRGKPTTD